MTPLSYQGFGFTALMLMALFLVINQLFRFFLAKSKKTKQDPLNGFEKKR